MAKEADSLRQGSGAGGWVATALDGIQMTLPLINEKRIKVIVNGGGLNPEGLATRVHDLVRISIVHFPLGNLQVLTILL